MIYKFIKRNIINIIKKNKKEEEFKISALKYMSNEDYQYVLNRVVNKGKYRDA